MLAAMEAVPRHEFVPIEQRPDAYADSALGIGFAQTISQPYIVAWMTQELNVFPGARVLEIGTGSGYQTAVLSELGAEVFTLEIVPALADRARETLARLGYSAVHARHGSGYEGWPDEAPFDRIIVTAAPPEIPQVLIDELAEGGRLVSPVGTDWQVMTVIDKKNGQTTQRTSLPVKFVPML